MDFRILLLLKDSLERGRAVQAMPDVQKMNRLSNCTFTEKICPNPKITFWLYKNETQDQPLQIYLDQLNPLDFEPSLPMRLLIHGYIGNRDKSPNLEVRPNILQSQAVHVISVDYGPLVERPCYYPWSVTNAFTVARCTAQLLDQLIEKRIYRNEDIHIIGFSLGAQIAGLMANTVRHRLKRITALDPAGRGFETNPLKYKLDPSDADFVDVVHTDPFLFSMLEPTGHADFYPNFGISQQPGCSFWKDGRFHNCNHFRAVVYYAESILPTRGFLSYNCGNWIEYLLHQCKNYDHIPFEEMGYFVSLNATGSYFLSTGATHPFAAGPIITIEREENDVNSTSK